MRTAGNARSALATGHKGWVGGAALLAALVLSSTDAIAQTNPYRPDPEKVKIRLGPLIVNPTITLGNIGSDENVFNDSTDQKRDFTMTLSPKTELWLPFLGSWFEGVVAEDLNWYRRYSSERAANTTMSLNWKLPLSRLTADVGVNRSVTRERPGFEIDARARHVQTGYEAAASFFFLPNTSIDFGARRTETDFDENAQFQDINLHDQLDSTSTSVMVGVSQKLTPLTTVSFGVNRRHDRFTFNPLRDSDSTDLTAAVRFDPAALLKGAVTVGYSDFEPASNILPSFTGVTMAADLSYAPLEVTKLIFRAERGVRYSYDVTEPYYLQTGFNAEVTQQVFGPVDLIARGGTASLDYRHRADLLALVVAHSDRVSSYGGGVGYHVGRSVRIGFNIDQVHRNSPIESRRYDRLTYGSSLTYDF